MGNYIGNNIRVFRINKGLNQDQLADIIGVGQSAVSSWENGETTPRKSNIQKLLDRFPELTFDDIFSEEMGYSKTVNRRYIPKGAIFPKKSERATAPLLGRVHAGDPQDPDVFDGPMIELPKSISDAHPDAYFLELEGDCMNKVYSTEASLVLIDPTMEPKNGDIGVVSINGDDYVIRRIIKTADTLILHPESFNPVHKDIVIDLNSEAIVESAGVAVFFQAKRDLSQP